MQVKGRSMTVREPHEFPVDAEKVWEPMIALEIITPPQYLQGILGLQNTFSSGDQGRVLTVGGNLLPAQPVCRSRNWIRDFDDQLKSLSAGYASFNYELAFAGEQETDAEKLEILVADEVVSALTRIVAKKDVEREARKTAERLKDLLPKQQFAQVHPGARARDASSPRDDHRRDEEEAG